MQSFLQSIQYGRWILPVLLFLPLVGAVVTWGHGVFEHSRGRSGPAVDRVARWLPFTFFVVEFLLSTGLWFYDPAGPQLQFGYNVEWIPEWGVHFALGVDGISLFLILLVTFLLPIAVSASWTSIDRAVHSYHALFLVLATGMLGVFMARDLFLFYVMWEMVLLPMYIIIGVWGGKRRVYAGTKFFLYTFLGSLLMLVAILYIGMKTPDPITGGPTFLYDDVVANLRLTLREQFWLFLAFFAAFATKIPLFPLHTWLPDAHTEAPTEGSVDLAAILLKMGSYGMMRFVLPFFPGIVLDSRVRTVVVTLAVIGIIYAALVAMVQTDFKRLIAYSSVSHMGFVVLGIFALTRESLQGAMIVQVSHGLSSGALFLMVGMVYDRRHTRQIEDFGGLARAMPLFSAFLGFAVLTSIGVPGTSGFVGEFLAMLGSYDRYPVFSIVAAAGVILSAVYMLWSYQRIAFNPLREPNRRLPDLNWREATMMIPIAVVIIWIGVYPAPFLRRMEPSVARLVQQVETGAAVRTAVAAPAGAPAR